MSWIDLVGYGGSALIALSATMNNIKWLRVLGTAGAALFAAYGAVLHAWPVVAVNLFILVTNVYYLLRMRFGRDYFTLNETLTGKEYFIGQFLQFYAEDIQRFFPDFRMEALEHPRVIVIMRNLNPVGLFVYTVEALHVLRIHLDYSVPAWRDLKNTRILLSRTVDRFRKKGYLQFVTESTMPKHQAYLKRLGFVPDENGTTFRRAV
jgi:hypothetical protein